MSQKMTIKRMAAAMGANLRDIEVDTVVDILNRTEDTENPRGIIEDAILRVALGR